jgi:hypothetical protein
MVEYRMMELDLIGFNNKYAIDGSNGFDDTNMDPLAEVNVLIEWLSVNKPTDMFELNELRRVLIESRFHEEVDGDHYSTGTWYQQTHLFGPRNILIIHSDTAIDYLLDLVDGLQIEMERKTLYRS